MKIETSKNFIPNLIVIILLLVAIALRNGAQHKWTKEMETSTFSISDIQKTIPEVQKYVPNSDKSLSLKDKNNNTLGYALFSGDFNAHFEGYAGETPLLVILNQQKEVQKVALLPNSESPSYLEYVIKEGLLNSWNNLRITQDSTLNIDAITGATYSSNAIINTVNKTIGSYRTTNYEQSWISLNRIVKMLLVLCLIAFSVLMIFNKKLKKIYWYHSILVLAIFGLWFKQMLSTESFLHWLSNGFPINSNPEIFILFLVSVAMAILGHKKHYCTHLCPMGALQTLINKISPLKKRSINFKIKTISLNRIYLTFIWVCLIIGYSLPLENMEPFKAFSFAVASDIMLIAGGVIIVFSFFFNRPWCQLCPTGCLISSIPTLKNHSKSQKK